MTNQYIQLKKLGLCICMVACILAGCRKFVEIEAPATSLSTGNVYTNDNSAISVLTAIYADMSTTFPDLGVLGLSFYPELSSDNLTLYNVTNQKYLSYYQNSLSAEF